MCVCVCIYIYMVQRRPTPPPPMVTPFTPPPQYASPAPVVWVVGLFNPPPLVRLPVVWGGLWVSGLVFNPPSPPPCIVVVGVELRVSGLHPHRYERV